MEGAVERWQGPIATILVLLITAALVALDVSDRSFRHWFAARAVTADVVAGLLVLLITVLLVDQVLRIRNVKGRSRATAAQAAILLAQARRAINSVRTAIADPSARDDATDEARTYMTMLLIAAPVLIDARLERAFLEQAQRVGYELMHCMASVNRHPDERAEDAELNAAIEDLRASARPLLAHLNREQRTAVDRDDTAA